MKIKKSQQEAVSLFEKFVGQLAMKLPNKTKSFFISLICGALLAIARLGSNASRNPANRHAMAPRRTDQRRLSTSILPYPEHRTQGGRSSAKQKDDVLSLNSLFCTLLSVF